MRYHRPEGTGPRPGGARPRPPPLPTQEVETMPEEHEDSGQEPNLPTESSTEEETSSPPNPPPEEPDETRDDDGADDDLPPHVRKIITKANGEAAKYRKQLREAEAELESLRTKEKEQKMSAEERAKAAEARAEKAEAEASAKILAAERRAALAGTVSHPDRVLRLMDDPDGYFDGTSPDVEKILEDFPEYHAKSSSPSSAPGAGGPAPRAPSVDPATAALNRGDVAAYAAALASKQVEKHTSKE